MRFLFFLTLISFLFFSLLNVVLINSWTRLLSVMRRSQEDLLVMAVCHFASKVNSLGIDIEAEQTERRLIPKTNSSSSSRFIKAFKKYQQHWEFLGTIDLRKVNQQAHFLQTHSRCSTTISPTICVTLNLSYTMRD